MITLSLTNLKDLLNLNKKEAQPKSNPTTKGKNPPNPKGRKSSSEGESQATIKKRMKADYIKLTTKNQDEIFNHFQCLREKDDDEEEEEENEEVDAYLAKIVKKLKSDESSQGFAMDKLSHSSYGSGFRSITTKLGQIDVNKPLEDPLTRYLYPNSSRAVAVKDLVESKWMKVPADKRNREVIPALKEEAEKELKEVEQKMIESKDEFSAFYAEFEGKKSSDVAGMGGDA